MALPRFMLLKSNANNKYLRYVKENANHAFLRFSYQVNDWRQDRASAAAAPAAAEQQDNMSYSHLRFEVENSATADGLVHIRSCYNNKYLVRRSVDHKNYITAHAHEAEEDQSKISCTLFKPIILDTNVDDAFPLCKAHTIHLLHVCESGQRSVRTSTALDGDHIDSVSPYLAVGDVIPEETSVDVVTSDSTLAFTAIDVEASAILPDYVTFMGHNNKFSCSKGGFPILHRNRLYFSGSDMGGQDVANKVVVMDKFVPQPISLWDREGLKYWHNDGEHVKLSSSAEIAYFIPIKVNNYTALKCVNIDKLEPDGTHLRFIGCDSGNNLTATATSITEKTKLRVGEPVHSRQITDVTYDTKDSRIYNVTSVEMYNDSRSNYTDIEQDGSFEIKYIIEKSMKLSQSDTVNLGIKTSLSFEIPVIQTAISIGMSYEKGQTWAWDEEVTDIKEVTATQTIKIPPKKKVTLKVVAQKGHCIVPFNCMVRDVMTDGEIRDYPKKNCYYFGCNEFQVDIKILFEDLDVAPPPS